MYMWELRGSRLKLASPVDYGHPSYQELLLHIWNTDTKGVFFNLWEGMPKMLCFLAKDWSEFLLRPVTLLLRIQGTRIRSVFMDMSNIYVVKYAAQGVHWCRAFNPTQVLRKTWHYSCVCKTQGILYSQLEIFQIENGRSSCWILGGLKCETF